MVKTKEVVVEFMENYLHEKGFDWHFKDKNNTDGKIDKNQRELHDVCRGLNKIANELQQFIGNTYNDRFKELTDSLISKLRDESKHNPYEAFRTVADELFSQDITWCRIVTFLVFDAELACRAIELSQEDKNNEDKDNDLDESDDEEIKDDFKMVPNIVEWVCKYIDKNLLQWINKQEGGWMNIETFPIKNEPNKSVRQYFGVAAFAVFLGGLYLCSKLSTQ